MTIVRIRFKNVVCAFIGIGMLTAYASGHADQVQRGGLKEGSAAIELAN